MKNTKLATGVATIVTLIVFHFLGRPIYSWIYWSLVAMGLPRPIVKLVTILLLQIFLFETVAKLLFLRVAVPPLRFLPVEAESLPNISSNELQHYTSELEQIGFIQLTDYTLPSSEIMARILVHPQKFCFAEIAQVKTLKMFCSISCHMEKNWFLYTSNISSRTNSLATLYAFFRQPRHLSKRFPSAPVSVLFQSLLDWREQVSADLGVASIEDTKVEAYFEREKNKRMAQRKSILGKSVTLGILEMLWFYLNPKTEWLGDYSKFRAKR